MDTPDCQRACSVKEFVAAKAKIRGPTEVALDLCLAPLDRIMTDDLYGIRQTSYAGLLR